MVGQSPASKLSSYRRPRLKADRRADVLGDAVFLTTEFRHYVVQGRGAVAVVGYLDGKRSVAEIADELSGELSLPETLAAVGLYAELGHLVDGELGKDRAVAGWWDGLGAGWEEARNCLAASEVSILAVGESSAAAAPVVARLLSDSEVGHVAVLDSTGDADKLPVAREGGRILSIVLADDYLDPRLASLNDHFLATSSSWLLARIIGAYLWLGPHFVPAQSACWKCLAQRISSNRQVERFVSTATRDATSVLSPPAMFPASLSAGAGILVAEATRLLVEGSSESLAGGLVTFDLRVHDSAHHPVVRQPQCDACGDPSLASPKGPVVLASQPAVYTDDGGHRVCNPSDTVERLERHVSPITGAISKLHRLTAPGDEISHAYAAGHNFALFTRSVYYLRRNLRGLAGGKGRSDIQARASAMSEAIERYTGVWRGDEPVTRGSMADLDPLALHPGELLCFSERQYATREEWNSAQVAGNHVVPEPFDPDRVIDWSQVWSLTEERPRLVPTSYCYYGHPDGAESPFCFADSNGSAAGNSLEEAVLQGLLELVERDSVAIWWYNRQRVPSIDLDSFGDPYIELLQHHYARMGRSLWMLDITSDLGIPVYAVISHRIGYPVEDIIVASGAHLEPRLAAMRALTECNQYLPMLSERDEEGNTVYLIDDREANNWWASASLETEPYLKPDAEREPLRLDEIEDLSGDDITKEIMTCVERIGRSGMDVLVLDQTRPDLDLHVVKVMAPGMRHFWRRLGPGRLYDVPVALGWSTGGTREVDLNPKSVFY